MRINEDVRRYLTLGVETLDEAPSAVMQNRGSREDRPRPSDPDRYGEGRARFGQPREGGERPAADASAPAPATAPAQAPPTPREPTRPPPPPRPPARKGEAEKQSA